MPNLAKRLCEAWVGATVANVAPELRLWSPSYRELSGTLAEPVAVLLQCSWAESRVHKGPSTRVSPTLVHECRSAIAGGGPLKLVRFVLIGDSGKDSIPELSSISLPDLIEVIEGQGKGTINAETLAMLRVERSSHSNEPMASPLADTLLRLKNEYLPTQPPVTSGPTRLHGPGYFGHYPTPLAITARY